MRDIILLLILFAFIFASFRQPYFMALGYLWVDFLQPQRMSYWMFGSIPVAMILGAGAVASYLLLDKERRMRFSLIQVLILLLVIYAGMATYGWSVLDGTGKWDWVYKALIFAAFLPLVLTTRIRIEAAVAVMIFSLAAITISAGLKTVLGGGGYGTMNFLVSNNTGLFEGSTLATTALAFVPIVYWFYRHNSIMPPSKLTRLATIGLIFSMLLVTIGAEARTGLVAGAMLALLVWLRSRRKILIGSAILAGAIAMIPFLPSSFTDRMKTIESFEEDASASTRLAVWDWTLDFVADNPLGGGFNVYRINELDVQLTYTTGSESNEAVRTTTITEEARAFHSSFFEVLGELGYPGFIIWFSIVVLVISKSWRLYRRERRRLQDMAEDDPDAEEAQWACGLGLAMCTAFPVYMTGSLFVGIAFQPAFYHLAAVLLAVASLREETLKGQAQGVPFRARLKRSVRSAAGAPSLASESR